MGTPAALRVGLNATCFDDRPSGARQRFTYIYGALIRDNPDIGFTIYEPEDVRVASWFPFANVTAVRTPISAGGAIGRVASELRYWRSALADAGLDLFETFNLPLVEGAPCPVILTIHDIRYVHSEVAWPRRTINRMITRRALAGAARVVTVSDTIRDEILAFRPATPVTTIYNGVDAAALAPSLPAEYASTLGRHRLSPPFALAVGHLEPRKNYPVLIDAFARLRDAGSPLSLVVVGRDGGSEADIKQFVAELGLAGRVTFLSDIDDAELRDLYSACELVVFPSLYEGFGIPVLEAMAAHKPLVLSDIPVFRELTEDHGCYFPATDSAALADRIDEVFRNDALRERLVAYGVARLPSFSAETLSAQVVAVYRDVLRDTAGGRREIGRR